MEETKRPKHHRHRHLTGEDIDMFRERESDNRRKREEPICDRHIDGA